MAKLGDDDEQIMDESMPFLFERFGDLSALKKNGCLTIAQCAGLLPAIQAHDSPNANATEMVAHRLMLAMMDVSDDKLEALHPETMLPWSQYLRMIEAGMFGAEGLQAPTVTAGWLVTLDECERWHCAKGVGVDLSAVKREISTLKARSSSISDVQMQKNKPEEAQAEPDYQFPLYARLEPSTQQFKGGRITDTDVLTLDEAAKYACKHAGTDEITPADFLRAAARGEITLRAIVHREAKLKKHDGGVYCNQGEPTENTVPKGCVPNLPISACQRLATAGRATWRTFDGVEHIDGELRRFTVATLLDSEPDFETVLADCRVIGFDVHALADEYIDTPVATSETTEKAVPPAHQSGVTKHEILSVVWPMPPNAPPLENILDDIPKWAEDACKKIGARGKGVAGSHIWNPALLAVCLSTKTPQKRWTIGEGALTNFLRLHFSDYLEEWENATGKGG